MLYISMGSPKGEPILFAHWFNWHLSSPFERFGLFRGAQVTYDSQIAQLPTGT